MLIAVGTFWGMLIAGCLLKKFEREMGKNEFAEFLVVNRQPFIIFCMGESSMVAEWVGRTVHLISSTWSIANIATLILGLSLIFCRSKAKGTLGVVVHYAGTVLTILAARQLLMY
jgi:hypothetical protein